MTADHRSEITIAERKQQLKDTRRRVLSSPVDQTMAAILAHPQPAALVHSFPEEDLHFLIHDVGLDNALPLLALASTRQWEYMLDMEVWNRDRLDYQQTTAWLQLLLRADPERLVKWCFDEKLEFLELYLYRNIEVRVRETEEAPSDFGDGFFTDDDAYYVRFVDYPVSTPQEAATKDRRNQLLGQLLRRLSLHDHPCYQGLLIEAAGTIPAENEEELFRLRNVRLAEKGFLPFHEAVGVYQPLRPGGIGTRPPKRLSSPFDEDASVPVPQFASAFLEGDNTFIRALKGIRDPHVIQLLQIELAGLCNRVIAADQEIIRGRDQLGKVVAKVSAYLGIGLDLMIASTTTNREKQAATLLQRHFLTDIFRTGFSEAMQLKWEATRWRETSWFQTHGLDLTVWDETWLGLLGGLLIDRPKFYDPSHGGANYRDFQTLKEIESTRQALNRIMALDRLLQKMAVTITRIPGNRLLTYKNLLLTQWARSILKKPPTVSQASELVIALAEFKPFYEGLWTVRGHRRFIDDGKKGDFLDWTARTSGVTATELSDQLGDTFEALFNELERELASVTTANLDPRYVHLFLLKN